MAWHTESRHIPFMPSLDFFILFKCFCYLFNCAGLLEQCWLWLDYTLLCGVKVKRTSLLKKIWQFPQCLGTIRENLRANLLSSNHYLVVGVKTVIASKSHYNLHPKAVPDYQYHANIFNCRGQKCGLEKSKKRKNIYIPSVENPQNNSITII